MADAQGRFRFDADTAAYNARMEESARKSKQVGEKFVDGFKSSVPVLGQVATAAGAIALAVDVVRKSWDQWLNRLKVAEQVSKQLGDRLAGVAGGAGLIAHYPQLKRGIEDAAGPLNVEQRIGAFGKFAGANPDLGAEHGIAAVQMAQKAALVVGADGVDRFVHALGIAIRAGLDQTSAGDMALNAAQAGDSGVEALDKLFASYLERFGGAGDGPSFLDYAKSAGSDEFGKKGIVGGTALQSGLARGLTLEGQARLAGSVDAGVSRDQQVAGAVAGADIATGKVLGDRAELIAQLKQINEAGERLGMNRYGLSIERRRQAEGDIWSPFQGGGFFDKYIGSVENLARIVDRNTAALLDAQKLSGAAEFRSEAHDEREP
jgi:hypothetical protein